MIRWVLIFISLWLTLPAIAIHLLFSFGIFYLGKLTKSKIIKNFGFNLAYSLDQYGNALLLGDPDETISSRTGRALKSGRPKWWVRGFSKFVDFLAFKLVGETDHCLNSIEEDESGTKELWSWIKSDPEKQNK